LGWTHGAGSGKAMAELIDGQRPRVDFNFYGVEPRDQRLQPSAA
jgi:D-amino-acid dehydrogenase